MPVTVKRPRPASKGRKSSRRLRTPVNELRTARQRYGLSQTLVARLLEVSLRTVSAAESHSAVPPRLRRNLTQLIRLCQALAQAIEAAFVGRWLDEPNELLNNLKPLEAIERGQIDLVWQVAEGLRSGSPL